MKYKLLDDVIAYANVYSDDFVTKVGACLVVDGKQYFGANRFYDTKGYDLVTLNANRDLKLQLIVHAECDALNKCDDAKGGVVYVNYTPCDACAKRIADAGVSVVIAIDHNNPRMTELWGKYWDKARKMFTACDVLLVEVKN